MTSAGPFCEMYCDRPLDAAADPPDPDWRNCCSTCRDKLDHLCRVVFPDIRKHGFHVPPDATDDERLTAMVDQVDARPRMREALRFVDDVPMVGGGTLADWWADPRWPADGSSR